MKKQFINVLLSAGLALTISSCKSDFEKYWEMMSEASNSPVTELVTPDSLNFNMNEDEYNSYIKNIPHKEIHYKTYWLLHFDDEVYAASFSYPKFYEGKLCRYEIWIDDRIENDSLKNLYPDAAENG